MTVALAQRDVLVLNKFWSAIQICSLEHAIGLLFKEEGPGQPKARIVDPSADFATYTWDDWAKLRPVEGEDVIQTAHEAYRIPDVILLTGFKEIPGHKMRFSRRALFQRDHWQCQYCGKQCRADDVTLDHVLPRAQGGKTTWENIACACVVCNSLKADKTPEQAGMKLRRTPKKPMLGFLPRRKRVQPKNWEHFLSEAYWEVELENDNK